MKRIICIIFVFLLRAVAIEDDSFEQLQEAYRKSSSSSYKTVIQNRNFEEYKNITEITYYRKYSSDGTVLLRADFYSKK